MWPRVVCPTTGAPGIVWVMSVGPDHGGARRARTLHLVLLGGGAVTLVVLLALAFLDLWGRTS